MAAQQRVHLLHLGDVLELVEHDQRPEAAALLEPQRQVEQRVQRGQRIRARVDLEPGADPERAEREAEARALQELLDPAARLPLQLPRVGALEADRDVGDREDAVEVDEDRDQTLLPLAVAEDAAQQARLAVLPRRVEAHVVAADRGRQQLARLVVPVDDVVGRERVRVDERVDVRDHGANKAYHLVRKIGTDRVGLGSLMQGRGFEPLKAEPAGLQPAPFGHSGTPARLRSVARPPQAVTTSRATRARLPTVALLAQLVEHLHGKEGVAGSSPAEGFPV